MQFIPRPPAGEGIQIVDYDERWPDQFAELADCLGSALGPFIIGIEHVGSTAVPGLAAKPVLDVDLVIHSREVLVSTAFQLSTLGYLHQGDLGVPGREAFSRRDDRVPVTAADTVWPAHNLYVCSRDSAELLWHLSFRNLLRKNETMRRQYERLKRKLALRCGGDREAYTRGKGTFVRSVLDGSLETRSLKTWFLG